jgi:hypothetical protein
MSTRFRRNPAIEAAPMQQETILYNPGVKQFCLLNATAAFLWDRLAQPATTEELSDAVCAHFQGVDRAGAERDVRKALEELQNLAVIVTEAQP